MPKVGQREQLENRERECFQFLQEIPMERRYVLIGGYAVSSFQFPRYSVDLDIVIPQRELRFFQGLARRKRFKFNDALFQFFIQATQFFFGLFTVGDIAAISDHASVRV